MYYKELTEHLLNIKLLSHLDRYKITSSQHFKSIIELQQKKTEAEWNLGKKELRASLKYIEEVYIDADRASQRDNIKAILANCGIKDSLLFLRELIDILGIKKKNQSIDDYLANSANFEIKHFYNLLIHPNFKELREYIFFKAEFEKLFQTAKSDRAIISSYIDILDSNISESFLSQLSFIESVNRQIEGYVSETEKQLKQSLEKLSKEQKETSLNNLFVSYSKRVDESIFVSLINIDHYNIFSISELSKYVCSIAKINSYDKKSLEDDFDKLIRFIVDSYILNWIEQNQYYKNQKTSLVVSDVVELLLKRNRLVDALKPDNIELFKEVEKQLANEGYFTRDAIWTKPKIDLVDFLLKCFEKGYFKYSIHKSLAIRRFFEKRYGVNITKQFQPNQRKKITEQPSKFYWLKPAL